MSNAVCDATLALVKCAIGLAVARHGLETEMGDVEEIIDQITTDVWGAMQGIGTCEGKPLPEWAAFEKAVKK